MKPNENPEGLKVFPMRYRNGCWLNGEIIEAGENVYAHNEDQARNGEGICEKCYMQLTGQEPTEPTETGQEPTEPTEPTETAKTSKGKGGK